MRQRLQVVLLFAGILAVQPLAAQNCPVLPEEFRTELDLFVDDLYELGDLVDEMDLGSGPEFLEAVASLDAAVDQFAAGELLQLCDVFARYPELEGMPETLTGVLPLVPPLGSAESECLELSRTVYLALFLVTQTLKGAEVVAQAVCDASACPVYSGVVVCAPVPPECAIVCPVTIGIVKILTLVSESFLIEDNNCGLVNHYALVEEFAGETETGLTAVSTDLDSAVIPQLDAAVSSRASQSSVDLLQMTVSDGFAGVGSGLDGVLADLAAQGSDREAFQDLERRLRIEANLQAGQTGRLSAFQLPQSLGGELERVRDVVADAILMTLAAGLSVHDAFDFFDQGDQQLNLQDYREAFRNYRLAYREAARDPMGPGGGR